MAVDDLRLPDFVMDSLRCGVCRRYLSNPPIQILPSGDSVCGICSNLNEGTYRDLTMEAFLNKISFSCEFRKYGCEERLQFGYTKEHEDRCLYRIVSCPFLSIANCPWEGSTVAMMNHFAEVHPNCVREKLEFKLKIEEDAEETFMAAISDISFIVKFKYKSGSLHCDVQHFACHILNVSYKIKLFNDADNDYSCCLKGGKCDSFNSNICNSFNKHVLTMNDYLKILNNPDYVLIAIEVTFAQPSDKLIIDYTLLDSIKCCGCNEYLSLPIFDTPKGVVCSNCLITDFSNSKPSNNHEMVELISKTNYPCRWEGCNFTNKGSEMRRHDLRCQYYLNGFPSFARSEDGLHKKFAAVGKVDEVITLLQSNGCEYFCSDQLIYEMCFSKIGNWQYFYTLKHGAVVLIQQRVSSKNMHEVLISNDNFSAPIKHRLRSPPLKCELQFEHKKTGVKSQIFIVDSTRTFTMAHLPISYKSEDTLTVNLTFIK